MRTIRECQKVHWKVKVRGDKKLSRERKGEKHYEDGYATLTDTMDTQVIGYVGYSLIRCLFGLFGAYSARWLGNKKRLQNT